MAACEKPEDRAALPCVRECLSVNTLTLPNILLLLIVLFENFHVGNCRSETKSAFHLSPRRSPMLLFGALGAFLIHVAAMHVPHQRDVLDTEPVSLTTWLAVVGLAFTVVPAMEIHKKWTWAVRHRPEAHRRP